MGDPDDLLTRVEFSGDDTVETQVLLLRRLTTGELRAEIHASHPTDEIEVPLICKRCETATGSGVVLGHDVTDVTLDIQGRCPACNHTTVVPDQLRVKDNRGRVFALNQLRTARELASLAIRLDRDQLEGLTAALQEAQEDEQRSEAVARQMTRSHDPQVRRIGDLLQTKSDYRWAIDLVVKILLAVLAMMAANTGARAVGQALDRPPLEDEVKAVIERIAEESPELLTPPPDEATEMVPAPSRKVPRNAPCPCGSGQKWKKCCGAPTENR